MNMENAQPETADVSQNRAISQEPKKPTAWIAAAVIFPLAFYSWFLLGSMLGLTGPVWVAGVFVLGIAACLLPIIICGLKEKFAFVAISLIGVVLFNSVEILFAAAFALAIVGAVRIAKPTSEWARRYYGPKKMAQALTRFALPKAKSDKNLKQKDSGLPTATRRRTGWIIAGTIGGLILLIPVLLFIGGMVSGLKSARQGTTTGAVTPSSEVTKRETETALQSAAESYLQNLGMEKFTSEEFGFSLMMPKPRSPAKLDYGTLFRGDINGHSIGVIAKDIPPSDPDYNLESVTVMRAGIIRGLTRNKDITDVESTKHVKDKSGHLGIEIIYTLTYGSVRYHSQGHAFRVGHRLCLVQIQASEAQWNKQLADSVLTTFGMR